MIGWFYSPFFHEINKILCNIFLDCQKRELKPSWTNKNLFSFLTSQIREGDKISENWTFFLDSIKSLPIQMSTNQSLIRLYLIFRAFNPYILPFLVTFLSQRAKPDTETKVLSNWPFFSFSGTKRKKKNFARKHVLKINEKGYKIGRYLYCIRRLNMKDKKLVMNIKLSRLSRDYIPICWLLKRKSTGCFKQNKKVKESILNRSFSLYYIHVIFIDID